MVNDGWTHEYSEKGLALDQGVPRMTVVWVRVVGWQYSMKDSDIQNSTLIGTNNRHVCESLKQRRVLFYFFILQCYDFS